MLVLGDDNERVRSRQDVWQTARSHRILVNPFLSRTGSFAWRRHEVGTLEYEVQVDGVRLYPRAGSDLRATEAHDGEEPRSMNAKVVAEWLRRVERDLRTARLCCEAEGPDAGASRLSGAAGRREADQGGAGRGAEKTPQGPSDRVVREAPAAVVPGSRAFSRPRPLLRLRLGASLSGRGPQPTATAGAIRNRGAHLDRGDRDAQSRFRALAGAA